jgi:hypothetical protein
MVLWLYSLFCCFVGYFIPFYICSFDGSKKFNYLHFVIKRQNNYHKKDFMYYVHRYLWTIF